MSSETRHEQFERCIEYLDMFVNEHTSEVIEALEQYEGFSIALEKVVTEVALARLDELCLLDAVAKIEIYYK